MTKRISIMLAVAYLFFLVASRLAEDLPNSRSAASDVEMIGIEKLHQQDVTATLSGDQTALAEL